MDEVIPHTSWMRDIPDDAALTHGEDFRRGTDYLRRLPESAPVHCSTTSPPLRIATPGAAILRSPPKQRWATFAVRSCYCVDSKVAKTSDSMLPTAGEPALQKRLDTFLRCRRSFPEPGRRREVGLRYRSPGGRPMRRSRGSLHYFLQRCDPDRTRLRRNDKPAPQRLP